MGKYYRYGSSRDYKQCTCSSLLPGRCLRPRSMSSYIWLFRERIRRNVIKPCMKRIIMPPASNKSEIVFTDYRRSLCRYALYAVTLCTLGATLWTMLGPSGDVITLTLTSSDDMIRAVYKCAYENPDGTVDLVFNIPRGGEELLRLNNLHLNASDVINGPSSAEEESDVNNQTTAPTVKPYIRTRYPISLDADYVINSIHLCPVGQQVDYLIVVHSATAYFHRRQTIRETYGGTKLFGDIVQRVVFLLGTTPDPVTTKAIQEEALIHRDIVQGRFLDSYHNLTHKGVLGYRWVSEHCPQAKLVVKIDDDVFLNPFKLVKQVLPVYTNKSRHIACHLRKSGTSPIVRGKGKWQVHEDEFKGQVHFPFDYCNGYFVIITSDLIRPMLNAARLNPFFWIDDVYLFGSLPATVGGTTFVNIRANLTLKYETGVECYIKHGQDCPHLAVSQWPPKEQEKLWYMVLSNLTATDRRDMKVFGMSR